MATSTLDRLHIGVDQLTKAEPMWELREAYLRGDHKLPYAPEGVSAEYEELRRQAIANWFAVAMRAPVQRMEMESISGADGKTDKAAWDLLIDNDLDTRAQVLFLQMMVHPQALMSVSKRQGRAPAIRVENCRRVYLHPDPDDPFRPAWAVKRWTEKLPAQTQLWVPASTDLGGREVAVVYDDTYCTRFEKDTPGPVGQWRQGAQTEHGLGEVPFVNMAVDVDADGRPHARSQDLIPMQDAINTIRFNALLAMQFSAYRQRVATGYDPVLRNTDGTVVYVKDAQGNEIVGPDGQPIPQLRQSGRLGVDRMLVFPGKDTKVFDLEESNLTRYMDVYNRFLTDFFSKGQVPPAYALDKMANLSGDALAGAEASLQSLETELKRTANSGIRRGLRLCDIAQGNTPQVRTVEWADRAPKSLGQIVDAVVKLIGVDFPHRAAWDMLPGATPSKLEAWESMREAERESTLSQQMLEAFTGPGISDPV